MRVTVQVPATSANLGPGFDALGLALGLHNTITLEALKRPAEPSVVIHGEGASRLPRTERNLALRAAQRVLRAAPAGLFAARIVLENSIPINSGLGSSAAAIAGAMVAANHISGNPFGLDELLCFALELESHPDNLAPALYGGFTVAVLDNKGRPVVADLPLPEGLRAVILLPELSISTQRSRAALPMDVRHKDASYTVGRAALTVAALLRQRYDLLRVGMDDRLHQPYRAAAYPAMTGIIGAALEAGACGAALSGSGPSILALCEGPTEQVAEAMRGAASRAGLGSRNFDLELSASGATVISTKRK